jgi:sugar phosphate isomerase/epimerase
MKYAICNETFNGWNHQQICTFIANLGYRGLEIAPFTLGEQPLELSKETRTSLKEQALAAGIEIIGLHWLLARTTDYHLAHPDPQTRRRTAQYLGSLGDLCHDLGGSFIVFGSPQQRNLLPGVNPGHAFELAVDTLRPAMARLGERGIRLCLEPLATTETSFINTCAEACQLIDAVEHPLCVLHLDVKALASECQTSDNAQAIAQLIRQYISRCGHFHANDPNRRGPGFGPMDFRPILAALRENHYTGWVSVEVFDYSPDPETIARQSLECLRKCNRLPQ